MNVAVFADIEGSFGIWRMRQCRVGTRQWQYGRECLTEDVNHVIAGAFNGGATSVTVKDTHEMGFNCIVKALDRRARYVGGHYVKPTLYGPVSTYDLVLYVAIHAAAGTPDAFFPHTHYGIFSEMRINGKIACEMDIYGGYLGEFNIPVGFVSGEDIAVKQALAVLPWARSVVVDKKKQTYNAGRDTAAYLAEGRKRLREEAAAAVREASDMKPLVIPGPLHFEAEMRSQKLADRFNTWGFDQSGRTIAWDAKRMIDGFESLNKLTFFPKKIYPFRRPMMFLLRNYYRIRTRYFHPAPDAGD